MRNVTKKDWWTTIALALAGLFGAAIGFAVHSVNRNIDSESRSLHARIDGMRKFTDETNQRIDDVTVGLTAIEFLLMGRASAEAANGSVLAVDTYWPGSHSARAPPPAD